MKHANKTALLVSPDIATLSALQSEFILHGIRTLVARDLPTALLAITQHDVDIAVVAARISEEGDGWSLSGVLRMIFPQAFLTVLAPSTSVETLKSAINNGLDDLHESSRAPADIAHSVLEATKQL